MVANTVLCTPPTVDVAVDDDDSPVTNPPPPDGSDVFESVRNMTSQRGDDDTDPNLWWLLLLLLFLLCGCVAWCRDQEKGEVDAPLPLSLSDYTSPATKKPFSTFQTPVTSHPWSFLLTTRLEQFG
jgi:cbb3-type cytochrome oxidase subunit 3